VSWRLPSGYPRSLNGKNCFYQTLFPFCSSWRRSHFIDVL
jgi:hypothetical protein